MSRIRSTDTKPEIELRKELWHSGTRCRIVSKLPGKPDVILPSARVAVFVDGCFWHGCPIHGRQPNTDAGYWSEKLRRNALRDITVTQEFSDAEWTVLRLWEHEIDSDLDRVTDRVYCIVKGQSAPVSTTTQLTLGLTQQGSSDLTSSLGDRCADPLRNRDGQPA